MPMHRLGLSDRETLTVTGVSEVVSLEEDAVVLHTELGALTGQGQGLRLKTLSGEGVELSGTVAVLSYQEPRGGSWLSRLLG